MEFFNPVIDRLQDGVSLQNEKAAIVAHNLANMDTPGFQRVSFTNAMMDARKRLGLPLMDDDDYSDGSVVEEKEMTSLGHAKVLQSSYLRLLSLQYGILKKVVSQGKG
jgi:flagellar basal body rod protein FlgB